MATEPAKLAEVNVDEVVERVKGQLFVTRQRITEKIEIHSEQINYWQDQLDKLDRFMTSNLLTADDPVSTEMNAPVSNEAVLSEIHARYRHNQAKTW